jgi:RHS repeat-associated protein
MVGTITVTYKNVGLVDVKAPLLQVTSNDADLRLPDQSSFSGPSVQFLGFNPSGPAGVLPAGTRGYMTIYFRASSSTSQGQTSFNLNVANDSGTIDWSTVEASARPSTIQTDAWSAIWGNFTSTVGTTVGQFHTVLAQDASYLSQLGESAYDVSQLMGFEIERATDFLPAQTVASSQDVNFPAPGLSMAFNRQFPQPISGRYRLGALGRGWTDNWDISATTDAQGNVTIFDAGAVRIFTLQSDGSYKGNPGDYGRLTLAGGVYQLEEKNGLLFSFRPDGSLDYEQDTNGNRITASYTNGLLALLTQSNGETLALAYNGQGRISQVTDPAGRITSYTYDASGEHLVSVTSPQGTTQYTYVAGQGAALEHALASITHPDGTHLYFSYDSQGRLIEQADDGNSETLQLTYGPGARVTATDGTGAATTTLFNEFDQPGLVVDPLNQTSQFKYDANRNLISSISPGGTTYTFGYNTQGDLVRLVDPLGHETDLTYDPQLNRLTSFRDPRGNTTSYSRDDNGNLLAITYSGGTSQQFSYDPLGNLTETINGRGQAINDTYNNFGQVTREDFADGTHISYVYDSHGNLVSAADSTGTTTLQYDSADRLTQVTYPTGLFLRFTYDAGGRRTRSVDQSGFTVNYSYDAAGRLSELTDGSGALIVHYSYDAAGRLARKDMGNGTYTTYTYDADGNVLDLTNYAPGGAVNSRFDYTYDALGRVITEKTLDGEWTYTYDAIGELTHAVFNSTNPSVPSQDLSYTYDANGNRVTTIENGVTTNYVANALNQYTSIGGATLAYDADGNLISETANGVTTNYTYDELNRLIGALGPGSTLTFSYDALGHLSSTASNGSSTQYLVDPTGIGNVLATYDGTGNLLAHYVQGLGLTSQVSPSGVQAFYDFDAIGSTAGVTNSSGSYVNTYSYKPFGGYLADSGTLTNPFTFIGQYGVITGQDGILSMRARYYDVNPGRFISQDPLGIWVGDLGLYSYAGNSPTNQTDTLGLFPSPNPPYPQHWPPLCQKYPGYCYSPAGQVPWEIPWPPGSPPPWRQQPTPSEPSPAPESPDDPSTPEPPSDDYAPEEPLANSEPPDVPSTTADQ